MELDFDAIRQAEATLFQGNEQDHVLCRYFVSYGFERQIAALISVP